MPAAAHRPIRAAWPAAGSLAVSVQQLRVGAPAPGVQHARLIHRDAAGHSSGVRVGVRAATSGRPMAAGMLAAWRPPSAHSPPPPPSPAHLCLQPQASWCTCTPSRALALVGRWRSWLSPSPMLPYRPQPQQYTSPSLVTHIECSAPAATHATCLPCTAWSGGRCGQLRRVRRRQAMLRYRFDTPAPRDVPAKPRARPTLSASTGCGDRLSCMLPRPSCPFWLRPNE